MTEEENNIRKLKEPKQIIIVRKDLNMSPGKLAAQVSHASIGCITKLLTKEENNEEIKYNLNLKKDSALNLWLSKRFTKVILEVKSESQLLKYYSMAQLNGINCCLITDSGFTEFDGKLTNTCIGIGPDFPKNLTFTKRCQLYKG